MPGLPPALPTPPGLPPAPSLPQPPVPPIPNLPSIPQPPICSLPISLPIIPPKLDFGIPAVVLCNYPLPLPKKTFVYNKKLPTFAQLLAKAGVPPIPPIPPLPPIPKNCITDNVLLMACGVGFGGGRTATPPVDPDFAYAA
jgi:hypothetical protein